MEPTVEPFVFSRTYDAPLDLVWAAWSSCDHMEKWWGPKGFVCDYCAMDFRPGGSWHYRLTGPNGMEMWGKFEYVEIVEGKSFSAINGFSDADGNWTRHPLDPTWPEKMMNVSTFEEKDGKTTTTTRSWPTADCDAAAFATFERGREGMTAGFTMTTDALAAYFEEMTRD